MVIEDKYFDLLHTLIYDKRRKTSGILSGFEVERQIGGYVLLFRAYMNSQNADIYILSKILKREMLCFCFRLVSIIWWKKWKEWQNVKQKRSKPFSEINSART